MRYLQIKGGLKLHLVQKLGDYGFSQPLCGIRVKKYRMTCNVPLGKGCKNCYRVYDSRIKNGTLKKKLLSEAIAQLS